MNTSQIKFKKNQNRNLKKSGIVLGFGSVLMVSGLNPSGVNLDGLI